MTPDELEAAKEAISAAFEEIREDLDISLDEVHVPDGEE